MQYRQFGQLDWNASALGFGCMRLPTLGEDHAEIDEPKATRMVRYAIDHGLNYIDTAYPYHGGSSERFVGRALKDGYREQVKLATKMPAWKVETTADFDKFLNEQLEKLQDEHIDFYLLHSLGKKSWTTIHDLGVLDWAEGAIADGRIGHLGFSFHDEYQVFEEIVDAYDNWTFCQVQYNFMDIENQAGTKGVQYAADRGLAVVVMEPLLGGRLVDPPDPIQAVWDGADVVRTPAEWALLWVWHQPQVSVVLSGMSTMPQVIENVAIADRSAVGQLTDEELALYDQVRTQYEELCPIPCTQCEYCMPCPNGVNIPRSFRLYNEGKMYDKHEWAQRAYNWASEEEQAGACIQCRECEDKCPQGIPISEWMPVVHEVLGEGKPYDACPTPG